MMTKDEIRHQIWNKLEEEKLGRFPFPLRHRIPSIRWQNNWVFISSCRTYRHSLILI
ncbi:hypothetical protein [Bacillus methanolicus]|uniref:hypothetical protein n=1 Tax=Bacillus methanolicus TaxID=1471 RepID=UPI002380B710|nr:hypothetical protein [Bacillus methanolicus]